MEGKMEGIGKVHSVYIYILVLVRVRGIRYRGPGCWDCSWGLDPEARLVSSNYIEALWWRV